MTINLLITIFILFIFHYVSDFILQLREDAINKSKSNFHLTRHVTIYSLSMTIYCLLFFKLGFVAAFLSFVFFFVFHWITDYFTSRQSTKAYLASKDKTFWEIIGLDQLIHQLHLLIYLYLLYGL